MNLLSDAWIPVREGGTGFQQISLQQLLCEPGDWQISLPRDDMEMACLQLLICLTQILFMPKDKTEWKQRLETPLAEEKYQEGIQPFKEWFDLNHPDTPFMQTRKVEALEMHPIQKLMTGLPRAGRNDALFNEANEIELLCEGCAAIALFNQASNCPAFSGKQMAGLRGAAPITTLISGENLKETIWLNVISSQVIEKIFPEDIKSRNENPLWVSPLVPKNELKKYIKKTVSKKNAHLRKAIYAHEIGIVRGLFWQPILIELFQKKEPIKTCSLCGVSTSVFYNEFKVMSEFYFTFKNAWPHLYGPRKWQIQAKKQSQNQTETFYSLRSKEPAWTQLAEFVLEKTLESEGSIPALPITQFRSYMTGKPLHLIVGGYKNKQAKILERCHELYSLAEGWEENLDKVERFIQAALDAKKVLRGRLFLVSKGIKEAKRGNLGSIKGVGVFVHEKGEIQFYSQTENMIHHAIRFMSFKEYKREIQIFREQLTQICRAIFEEVTRPYQHEPEIIPILSIAKASLNKELRLLQQGE